MISQVLAFLLIVSLPLQLGRHFWPAFSYLSGLRIDYLSVTLYLQDCLLAGALLVFSIKKQLTFPKPLLFLLPLFIVNVSLAINPTLAIIGWFRVSLLLLLLLVVYQNQKLFTSVLAKAAPLILIPELLIGLSQLIRGSSLGGVVWWLGERSFSIITPGIAKAEVFGQLFLRPYGTFSHPNSLAGFALVLLIFSFLNSKQSFLSRLGQVCGFLLITLCLSRVAVFALFLVFLLYLFTRKITLRRFQLFLFPAVLLPIAFVFNFANYSASISERWYYLTRSVSVFLDHPVFGVGLSNYLVALNQSAGTLLPTVDLQPVHTIYLLALSEIGFLGAVYLFLVYRRSLPVFLHQSARFTPAVFALLAILLTGLFDHYWLTLVQNQYLFVIILGLVVINPKPKL